MSGKPNYVRYPQTAGELLLLAASNPYSGLPLREGKFREAFSAWWCSRSSKPSCGASTASQVGSIPMHFRHFIYRPGREFAASPCGVVRSIQIWHYATP